jgi:hypothetical protein
MEVHNLLLFLLLLFPFAGADAQSVCAQSHSSAKESYDSCCKGYDGQREIIDNAEYIYHCDQVASTQLVPVTQPITEAADCARQCSSDAACKGAVWDSDRTWQQCWLVKYQTKPAGANTHILSLEKVEKSDCKSEKDAVEQQCQTDKDAAKQKCDDDASAAQQQCAADIATAGSTCDAEKTALTDQCEIDKTAIQAACDDACQPKIDAAVEAENTRWEGCYDYCYPWQETVDMYCGQGTSDGGLEATPRNWYKWSCHKTWDKKDEINSISTIKRLEYYRCLQGCDDMPSCQGLEAREDGCYYFKTNKPTKKSNGKTFALFRTTP